MDTYIKALSRDDLSYWLVHFCRPHRFNDKYLSPFESLKSILNHGRIYASKMKSIIKYEPRGASCFYDIPPQNWWELINTNPNNRRGYGLIVSKSAFWFKGGRPCIYTDKPTEIPWPANERFRLVFTDLLRQPKPADWTHEREWRILGDFTLEPIPVQGNWWWPCVERVIDCQELYRGFVNIYSVYVMELNKVLNRNEIYF